MPIPSQAFCLDFIKIRLEESEIGIRDINLKTSELTKCEWCGVRKLPVVFLQTVPAACLTLRSQLKMSREKDNIWYDCKGANPEEQYIILIFETGLDPHGNAIFEKIIADIGVRNNISDFFVKIPFEEANINTEPPRYCQYRSTGNTNCHYSYSADAPQHCEGHR
ncbi:UNVERIFIED_CONTAM: Sentrin-specific protease 6 [Gekko kuhli]